MRIAILGATSQIARDLILSFEGEGGPDLALYARRPETVQNWLSATGRADRWPVADFSDFGPATAFDAVINFVGVGDPAQALAMGAGIFEATLRYDEMALAYVQRNPACRYIFLSSGAAYGSRFDAPADENTPSVVDFNNLRPQDWYGVAKLHAECRHRASPHLPIVDVRVFNYFARTQDLSARFLIMDIMRAIRENKVLQVSPDYIVRDFMHPSDFHGLIQSILQSDSANAVVDCYTRAPIDKTLLLGEMQERFGLKYEVTSPAAGVNATGGKPYYYSKNRRASRFGYEPRLSSLEGILLEAPFLLGLAASR